MVAADAAGQTALAEVQEQVWAATSIDAGGVPIVLQVFVTMLAILVASLYWTLSDTGAVRQSRREEEYWELRRHRIAASVAELLRTPGCKPARRIYKAIVDDFEEVLVTRAPISVPMDAARLPEMAAAFSESLGAELETAMRLGDLEEIEELSSLGLTAQQHLGKLALPCGGQLQEAAIFLGTEGRQRRRRQLLSLLQFCDAQILGWLVVGIVIKIASQVPGPLRVVQVSYALAAAARGDAGLAEFQAAALKSCLLFATEKLLQCAGRVTMFRGEMLFTRHLKSAVYAACLCQDMEYFDVHRSGELISRLNSDTKEICQKLLYFPVRFVQMSFFLLFNFAMLAWTAPQLVMTTASIIPVAFVGNLILMKRLKRYYTKVQKRAETSASTAQEVLNNIRTVRAFVREPFELHRYMRDQDYEGRMLNHANMLQSITQPIMHSITETSFFVGLYYGGLLIAKGMLESGQVITLVQGTQACTGVLTDLFDTIPEIAKSRKPLSRVINLLEREPRIESKSFLRQRGRAIDLPAEVLHAQQSAVQASIGGVAFQDVRFHYPSRPGVEVLSGLSFKAPSGEVVALVGATGCGKSTVASLLMRFYEPTQGTIYFDGTAIGEINTYALRLQIGMVAQEPLLFGGSVRENLLYGADPLQLSSVTGTESEGMLRRVCELAKAWEFIEKLPEGLSTEVGERGIQLSGGQKQRLAIARAILRKPKALVLDEATSALDVHSEVEVQRALDEVIQTSLCTTIVIAHRLSTVRAASQVIVIANGVVQEELDNTWRHEPRNVFPIHSKNC